VCAVYKNYYRCPNDGTEWKDEWSCMCNDRCPECNAEIEPYDSKEVKDRVNFLANQENKDDVLSINIIETN